MKRGFLLVHFISFFCALFSMSSFVSGLFGVMSISAGLAILVGVFVGKPHVYKFSYKREFLDACKTCEPHSRNVERCKRESLDEDGEVTIDVLFTDEVTMEVGVVAVTRRAISY